MTDPAVATTFPVVTVNPALTPDQVRRLLAAKRKSDRARKAAEVADAELHATVREVRLESGASHRKIGEVAGLSHTQVRFIVDGRPPRKPADASPDED